MAGLDARIQDLVTYAETKGNGDKTVLFRSLIDLFLTDQAPTKQPMRRQLLKVIASLIPNVTVETRHTAAGLIASMPIPPADLAAALATDSVDIVEPLLLRIPFDEDDLIELITNTGKDHHQVIATRSDLSANIWIALARASRSMETEWDAVQADKEPQTKSNIPSNKPTSNVTPLRNSNFSVAAIEKSPTTPDYSQSITSQHISDAPHLLAEPENGGWAFSSDRDGFVTALSDRGITLLTHSEAVVGSPLLDFLGLNAKLGHPVARAFQRRSAVHNSPIYLNSLPKGKRYWTLSARPFFNPETGGFAGYQGQLAPAASTQFETASNQLEEEAPVPANPDEKRMRDHVGLEPVDTGLDPLPAESDTLFADEIETSKAIKHQEPPITPAFISAPTEAKSEPAPQADKAQTPVSSRGKSVKTKNKTAPSIDQLISGMLDGAVRDRIEHDVKKAVSKTIAAKSAQPEIQGRKLAPVAQKPQPVSPEIPVNAETVEALETLDQALAALRDDADGKRVTNRSLQIGIAEACCKALRESLTKQ